MHVKPLGLSMKAQPASQDWVTLDYPRLSEARRDLKILSVEMDCLYRNNAFSSFTITTKAWEYSSFNT